MTNKYCNNYKTHILVIVVLNQTAGWYTKSETNHRIDTLTPKRQGIHQNGTQTALIILTMKTNLSFPVMFKLIDFENVEELNTTLHQFMIIMTVCNWRKSKWIAVLQMYLYPVENLGRIMYNLCI